jgi:hypothetical protein
LHGAAPATHFPSKISIKLACQRTEENLSGNLFPQKLARLNHLKLLLLHLVASSKYPDPFVIIRLTIVFPKEPGEIRPLKAISHELPDIRRIIGDAIVQNSP